MTIDQTQSTSVPFPWTRFLRPSHRTRPEQLVGLGIFFLLSIGFELATRLTTEFFGTLYFCSLTIAMWTLWRRYSLRVLKIEFSVFLSQFIFQATWAISYFVLQEELLSLVALLLLWSSTLLAMLLFWKKEKISGAFFLFPLVWIFYLVGLNMVLCITNP